jgi:hypothetical protein
MILNDPKLFKLGATLLRKTDHPAPRMKPTMTERDIRNPSLEMGVRPAVEDRRSTSMFDIRVFEERVRRETMIYVG